VGEKSMTNSWSMTEFRGNKVRNLRHSRKLRTTLPKAVYRLEKKGRLGHSFRFFEGRLIMIVLSDRKTSTPKEREQEVSRARCKSEGREFERRNFNRVYGSHSMLSPIRCRPGKGVFSTIARKGLWGGGPSRDARRGAFTEKRRGAAPRKKRRQTAQVRGGEIKASTSTKDS